MIETKIGEEIITCSQDYHDFKIYREGKEVNGMFFRNYSEFIPKQCPYEIDDHCQLHCPKDETRLEETDPQIDEWELEHTVIYSLTCYDCGRNWGTKTRYYKEVE